MSFWFVSAVASVIAPSASIAAWVRMTTELPFPPPNTSVWPVVAPAIFTTVFLPIVASVAPGVHSTTRYTA